MHNDQYVHSVYAIFLELVIIINKKFYKMALVILSIVIGQYASHGIDKFLMQARFCRNE